MDVIKELQDLPSDVTRNILKTHKKEVDRQIGVYSSLADALFVERFGTAPTVDQVRNLSHGVMAKHLAFCDVLYKLWYGRLDKLRPAWNEEVVILDNVVLDTFVLITALNHIVCVIYNYTLTIKNADIGCVIYDLVFQELMGETIPPIDIFDSSFPHPVIATLIRNTNQKDLRIPVWFSKKYNYGSIIETTNMLMNKHPMPKGTCGHCGAQCSPMYGCGCRLTLC